MRARNIKPGFFKNEVLGLIDPLARLLFVGLWCYCDREGRFEWRPMRIKAEILPYDNCNIDQLLNILVELDEIKKYKVDQKMYGFIPNFTEHQNPHNREIASICPPFEEKHNLGTDEAQPRHGRALLNPESLILNPESLNPERNIKESTKHNLGTDKAQPRSVQNNDGFPYKEIINHLNEKTNSGYKHTTEKYRRLIRARWKEGFKLEDFFYVIEVKAHEWIKDENYKKFLRPETLFGSKFESYRNQKPTIKHIGALNYLRKKGAI